MWNSSSTGPSSNMLWTMKLTSPNNSMSLLVNDTDVELIWYLTQWNFFLFRPTWKCATVQLQRLGKRDNAGQFLEVFFEIIDCILSWEQIFCAFNRKQSILSECGLKQTNKQLHEKGEEVFALPPPCEINLQVQLVRKAPKAEILICSNRSVLTLNKPWRSPERKWGQKTAGKKYRRSKERTDLEDTHRGSHNTPAPGSNQSHVPVSGY